MMNTSYEISTQKPKPFTITAIVIFILVSLVHLVRLILDWEVIVNGVVISMWVSGFGFLIAGGLAFMLQREMYK